MKIKEGWRIIMLKIGEFSKLSHLTVKTLRFYEKEGLLIPAFVDQWTGYRFYQTSQLEHAARIKGYRQLGLSIEEIKAIWHGADAKTILMTQAALLQAQKQEIDVRLSIIYHSLEEQEMKYQVTVKQIPETIVYYAETTLPKYADMMQYIPKIGAACRKLNPNLRCTNPSYAFCEYLDEEYRESNVRIRYNEAVTGLGMQSEEIKFRTLPTIKVLSILHKGAYEQIGEAYTFLIKYAEENGYQVAGLCRECYLDGIWNKASVEDWLTEVQLPIK